MAEAKLAPGGAAESHEPHYSAADIGAIAHLYRGEMYRSKIWRSRLDATTNWAVVTTGIALSVTFASAEASVLPVVLVSLLVLVFWYLEGRRYRYFDIWRTRVRVMENNFYGPILLGRGIQTDNRWTEVLVDDYKDLTFHISMAEALGRRLRRNYAWIFGVIVISYVGKLCVHPTALENLDQLFERATIGPLAGQVVLALGSLFYLGLVVFGVVTLQGQKAVGRVQEAQRDRIHELATREHY